MGENVGLCLYMYHYFIYIISISSLKKLDLTKLECLCQDEIQERKIGYFLGLSNWQLSPNKKCMSHFS